MGTIADHDFHLPKPNMTDDGLPQLDSLSNLQYLFASNFASVIAHACLLKARSADPEEAECLGFLKTRLIKDALWAVSEVQRSSEYKIRRQRYISQGVYDLWTALVKDGVSKVGPFMKDANGNSLIHEHVVQRKGLETSLNKLTDEAAIRDELCRVSACVVTKAEHQLLEPHKKHDGWVRYDYAQIRVYDRLEKQWLPARALEI